MECAEIVLRPPDSNSRALTTTQCTMKATGKKSFVKYMPSNLQDYSVYLGMYHMLNTVKLQNYFHEFCFNGKIILVSLGIEPVPYI